MPGAAPSRVVCSRAGEDACASPGAAKPSAAAQRRAAIVQHPLSPRRRIPAPQYAHRSPRLCRLGAAVVMRRRHRRQCRPVWPLLILAGALLAYLAAVLVLVLAGRRTDARALAGFVPDCLVLCRRLLADSRVPRRHKALLA